MMGSLGMFSKYGIRSVTMDDVARELGISKKTIYKYFENKADLIDRCVGVIHGRIKDSIEEVHAKSENPIDELFEINDIVKHILEKHNPALRFQLEKYYPQAARKLYEDRKVMINRIIKENMERGMEQGWYRSDIEADIITRLYCSKLETAEDLEAESELLARYGMEKLMCTGVVYHLRGIVTDKGLEYLENKIGNIETIK